MIVGMKPNMFELGLIVVLGALQPAVEWTLGESAAARYNVAAVLVALSYVALVLWRRRGVALREWGFRTDNLAGSILPYGVFTLAASGVIWLQGAYLGNDALPSTFWYVLALYPLWGLAQQFALQNLVVRNLGGLIPSIVLRALLVALLFGIVHLPSVALFVEAGVAGFFFVLLYHRYPNLYAIGVAHGIVGALVFHLILGQNQWEILTRYFS